MTSEPIPKSFVSLKALAGFLGLPQAWLREQADDGTIPHLSIGGRRFFDVLEVREALLMRMKRAVH